MEAAVRDAFWFPDADLLIHSPEELPEDALRAAGTLGLGTGDALAVVRQAWSKIDAAARADVGSAGEHALMALLSAETDVPARHVAAESDGYGYDIEREPFHIEVKSTTRRGRLSIYLSRHEYETMRRDPFWILVTVRLDQSLQPVAVATVNRDWISARAPADKQVGGRWESARFDVPHEALTPGCPALAPFRTLGFLAGTPPWPG
ncbi:DUF3883 domain-containing protein [Nonomuraea sp. NPDC050556]|uniref:DUF3883 domain-containing protein n=1 Tax=Nonomuraea sp. NPDC050556 TaxID=3364369 RepID=UPI00378F2F66